jgi:hypothetical protein
MMHEKVLRDFSSLPAEAQRQVTDFIAFLQQRYGRSPGSRRQDTDWESEPFVGMWRDREDLQDSTEWVRSARRQEWFEPGG